MNDSIVPLEGCDEYAVSILQEQEVTNAAQRPDYHFNCGQEISLSDVDEGILTKAVLAMIERHEPLRTTFRMKEGVVTQVIHEGMHPEFKIGYVDLIPAPEKYELLAAERKASVRRVFDFQKGPLLDIRIVRLTQRETILLFSIPHANCDYFSFEVLRAELAVLYAAYKDGKPNPLPPLSIQYKEYAAWHNCWIKSSDCRVSQSFYKKSIGESIARERVAGAVAGKVPDPPAPEPPASEPPAGCSYFSIGQELTDKLRDLATDTGTTLLPVVLSVFGILFYRLFGKRHFRIDVPVTTRDLEEFQNIIGWLMAGIIVCFDVDGDLALYTLIQRVTAALLETMRHKYYPGSWIMNEIALPVSQLSPIQINLVSVKGQSLGEFEPFHVDLDDAYFDLSCEIGEYDNGMAFKLTYKKSLYTRREIGELAKVFVNLIGGEDLDPAMRIASIAISGK